MIWKQFKIFGLVQGVGFRYFIKNIAKKLGIVGYVKNELDGSVTIIAGGSSNQLEMFREYIVSGNGYSNVEKIVEENIPKQDFESFYIQF
ncbi:acylphosphatase [Thermosipho atlanticus]|nr:acylphosphatase [Thermosipho atlanticus]